MRASAALIEVVGDGVLVTFYNGSSLLFEERAEAEIFGRKLMMVAALGDDVIETGLPHLDEEGSSDA